MLTNSIKSVSLAFFISVSLIFSFVETKAQNYQEIKQAAENFYLQNNKEKSNIEFSNERMLLHNNTPTILLLQIESGGFIAMAANQNVQPVLAYSFRGQHDITEIPAPAQHWFNAVSNKISKAQSNSKAKKQWTTLMSKSGNPSIRTSFLMTTKWGQGCYYNELCPETENPDTYCGHTVVGCVATAAAQVMKHWEHPQFGTGSHSYETGFYGTQSADFGSTEYLWDQMPDSVGEQNIPVATLMYHCGVAHEMEYTATSSGSNIAAQPLIDFFSYSPNAKRIISNSHTESEWINCMKQEIDAGRPVLYAGFNDEMGISEGHAWVCDGYDTQDFLHFNWGWNSLGGFYNVSESIYPDDNEAIIEIMPIKTCDVIPTSIIEPYSQTFTEPATVSVQIENYGSDPISDIPVSLFINDTETLTETIPDEILPHQSLIYEFENPIDLTSMSGEDIDIKIVTNLACDEYSNNDSLTKQIRNVACASPPYENDFSTADLFIGWLTEDGNNDGNTWFHSQNNSDDLIYQGNINPANDWVFSQCLVLEPNKMYKLSFDYASTGIHWDQKLKIHLGNSPESGGMTSMLDAINDFNNSDPQTHEILFTTEFSGHHYIGFHCTSEAEMLNLIIDNFSLSEQSETDIAVLEILSPQNGCNMETESLSVLIQNQCSQTLTDIPISYNLDGGIVQETITESLSPGEIYEYTFNENLNISDFDNHNVQVFTSLADDVDNTNDSVSIEIINTEAIEIPYAMPFETENDITHWLIDNANDDNRTWEYNAGMGYETYGYMLYQYNDFNAADDWLISQCIYLETDMLYDLSFYTKIEDATWPENLSLMLANAQSAVAMQDTIINLPELTVTNWSEINAEFQVEENGFYYLGFHCYSDAQMFNLYLDDISLNGESLVQIENHTVFDVHLSPNPAKTRLNVNLTQEKPAEISIYDIRGQLMMTKSLQEKHNQIPIHDFPVGMYILEIKQDGEILRKKFIKG
jgi:hypothetical protein